MKKAFLTLLVAVLLFSCSNNVDLAIDNPSKQPIHVTIDTLEVEVPARQVVWVEMGKGEHTVTLANDSVVKYNFTESVYMLNPTLSEYLMYEEFYGDQFSQSLYRSSIPNKTVEFLGIEMEGNYNVVRDLVNQVTWDYGPREALPEMIQMVADESYVGMVKLSDPIEFYEMVAASYGSESLETETGTEDLPLTDDTLEVQPEQ